MIVATAGHVDHGKTSLVKALTGVDADRLPEEKKRGMTIDLGFAYVAGIGFVDVPGHERFVHNMLAGVSGIDLALLVVAADDGPMPQTREHVAILDLLGVRRAVVALTKIDLVGSDRADEVERGIKDLVRGTTLADAPVVRVSSTTGAGIDALKETISSAIEPLDERGADVFAFRMPALRAFVAEGRGTVVTGIPVAG